MNFFLKKKSYNIFNLLVIGLIFTISVIFTVVLDKYFPYFFQHKLDKQNYYDSLYGNSNTGCSTIEYVDPEIVFIGDSTGYHSWDFNLFEKKTKKRIGACFLQGFSILSSEHLINFLQKKNIKPKFIILSNSYRIFLNKKINEGYAEQHKKYLNEIENSKYQKNFQIISKYVRGKKLFKVTIPVNKEINIFLDNVETNKINSIVKNIILQNKEASGYKNYKSLKQKFNDKNFYFEQHEKDLIFFCNFVLNNKIKLIFANVPISKTIENLVHKKKNENDIRIFNYLKKCTNNQVYFNDYLHNYDLNNKYFMLTNNKKNNYLKFKEYILNPDDKKYDPGYFDFSHMNRYGSEIFTKAWLEKNYSLFKIENK